MNLRNQIVLSAAVFLAVFLLASLPLGSTISSPELPVLEDFSDNEMSNNPGWATIGQLEVRDGLLQGTGTATAKSMYAYGTWEFAFYPVENIIGNHERFWIVRNSDDGYYVAVGVNALGYRISLEKTKGSIKKNEAIITQAPVLFHANKLARVRVTRDDNGVFTLYVNGHYYGRGEDNSIIISDAISFSGNNLRIKKISASPDVVMP